MNKQERRQMFARQAREQKARDDAYHAARVAASQARHAANAARVAAQMEEMEKVPADDYDVIAAQELREKLGVSDSYEFDTLTIDSGLADYRRHCGWAGLEKHLFFFFDARTNLVHPAKVVEKDGWQVQDGESFYRSANDKPLTVDFASPLKFKPADWHTVDRLGTPTDDGDKVLIVVDDDHHLQDVVSSAISLIAPGTYKLSELKKPNTDWDESYWY